MATPYKTVAERSHSVFCLPEPANTKAVFRRVAEELLRELERLKGSVRFVQIGANDGQRGAGRAFWSSRCPPRWSD